MSCLIGALRKGRILALVLVALSLPEPVSASMAGSASAGLRATATEGRGISSPEPSSSAWGRMAAYFGGSFPRHLVQGARESFWGKNLVALLIAGGASAALLTADDEISDHFRDERPVGDTAEDIGTALGSPQVVFGLSAGTYLLGEFARLPRVRETGEVALESLSLVAVSTGLLKLTTNRERPDGSDSLSFPSFHAAGSFAIAASLHETWGLTASVPAFLTAGFISLTRIQKGKHFPSDTFFGGALGTVIGLAMGKLHPHLAAKGVQLLPQVAGKGVGMTVSLAF